MKSQAVRACQSEEWLIRSGTSAPMLAGKGYCGLQSQENREENRGKLIREAMRRHRDRRTDRQKETQQRTSQRTDKYNLIL